MVGAVVGSSPCVQGLSGSVEENPRGLPSTWMTWGKCCSPLAKHGPPQSRYNQHSHTEDVGTEVSTSPQAGGPRFMYICRDTITLYGTLNFSNEARFLLFYTTVDKSPMGRVCRGPNMFLVHTGWLQRHGLIAHWPSVTRRPRCCRLSCEWDMTQREWSHRWLLFEPLLAAGLLLGGDCSPFHLRPNSLL